MEPAEAALIPLVFVDDALATEPAGVDVALPDASTEKALASVAAGGAVVLARGLVPADGTVGHHAIIPMADIGLCWHAVFPPSSGDCSLMPLNLKELFSCVSCEGEMDEVLKAVRHVVCP